jgi:hypothetical protein
MRRLFFLAACLLAAVPAFGQKCDKSLAAHVYHPNRLATVKPCMEVRGTILDMRVEKDGDYHILIKLDATQPDGETGNSLLNAKNQNPQKGCLVVEPICKGPVTQQDAIVPCQGAKKIKVPAIGAHVSVIGPYVKDNQGGHGWMEIHPVTSITVTP